MTLTLSAPVRVELEIIFTLAADRTVETSPRSLVLSNAFTSIAAVKVPPLLSSHSTSISRFAWPVARATPFAQSLRCIETPLPLVTKPIISSGGTGVQHLASLIMTSSTPSTTTPTSFSRFLFVRPTFFSPWLGSEEGMPCAELVFPNISRNLPAMPCFAEAFCKRFSSGIDSIFSSLPSEPLTNLRPSTMCFSKP